MRNSVAALLLSMMVACKVMAQIPAFPGAEGFGAYATGGRGGDVYTVVNLNSSGPGSLRYGVETAPAQGRTIVFAVSGNIPVSYNADTGNQTIRIVQSKVTIAGQTAPGDGIGLRDGRILVTGNNVVLRHLRIRHGKYGGAGDCLNLESSADNSIIDHVSLMFSTDENISFFNSSLDNFTMQYSTSSWGMERHNAGGLWDLQRGSCHHSLWAHHRTRNPKARPTGLLEWINNVTYHWRGEGFIMGDSQTPINWYANVRGCYYLSIPDFEFGLKNTGLNKARISDNGLPNFHLYLDNCLHDADGNGLLNGTDKGYGIVDGLPYDPLEGAAPGTVRYSKSPTPFPGATGLAAVGIDDPLTAYKKVISSAGALRMDANHTGALRDELDTLLIETVETQASILVAKDTPRPEYTNDPPSNGEAQLAGPPHNISNSGFGTLNSTPAPADTDGDGMSDAWETTLGWNVGVQDHNIALTSSGGYVAGLTFFPSNTPAGYTRLEEYLHFLSLPHATMPRRTVDNPSSLTVDLLRYTRGFNQAPVAFSFSHVTNGTVTLQPDGHTVVFTPKEEFAGRARFNFTVLDGDGSSWTQTMAVLVSAVGVPRNLKWKGDGVGNDWNTVMANFLSGTNPTTFQFGDAVRFDDSGSNSPAIHLGVTLAPGAIEVNAVQHYTLIGAGGWSGSNSLTKLGTGTLTVGTTNSGYSGGINVSGGTLSVSNANALGTGLVTLASNATLNLAGTLMFPANVISVPAAQSANVNSSGGLGNGFSGGLTGVASSVMSINSGVSFSGTTSAQFDGFAGTIVIAPAGMLRFSANSSGNHFGSTAPTFVVNGTWRPRNAGNTINLGAFSGTGTIAGPQSNAGAGDTTYHFGANHSDGNFAGVISSNSAVAGSQVIVRKLGNGTLTLGGASTFTGGTTVLAGRLLVNNFTGSGTGSGALTVAGGATLGGVGIIASPTVLSNAAILAPGMGPGTLTFNSTLSLSAAAVVNFELGTNSDRVIANGPLLVGGVLNVTDAGGFGPGSYPLFTYNTANTFTYGGLNLGSLPPGFNYSLSTSTSGQVNLRVSPVTPPAFSAPVLVGGSLILAGTGGTPGIDYHVLSSTNVVLPLGNWQILQTNQFDANGAFLFTNVVNGSTPRRFFRLQVP